MSDVKESLTAVQRGLIIGVLVAALIGLGYWWYTTLVWEEKEIDLGYSKEARQNDFLAAEIFLRKQGVQATTVKNLSLLDKHSWRNLKLGAQDTLVIINGNKTLTQERYDALYEWVENGGTLITSTQNPFIGTHTSEEDLLLNDFNIELPPEEKDTDTGNLLKKLADSFDDDDIGESADESGEDSNQATTDNTHSVETSTADTSAKNTRSETVNDDKSQQVQPTKTNKKRAKTEDKPENYYRCTLKETPAPIAFAGEEQPLNFDFSHNPEFIYYDYVAHDSNEDENTESDDESEEDYHYDKSHEHLLYFDIGQGSVTITSDNHIWSNQRIDCHDHAYGLWRLINPEGRVWFLINQDAPSLASILWRNASYGVSAGIIALVLWLWANSIRFGPVRVIEQSGRRSLAEHIYASAMLLWRKQQHPQLLNLLRKDIIDRLDELHPHLNQPSGDQRMEFLHQITGIAQTDIKQALFADGLHHPQEFAAAIAHLQTIRKQLSGSNYDRVN